MEYKKLIRETNKVGLLIEGDAGFIEPTDSRNRSFITEVNKIGKGQVIAEPLVLFVVLQKFGVENKNGRIYPESILRREATNYQKLIDMRLSIGECVPRGTEIFTKDGWREIQDMVIGDEIFTLNTKTNELEVQSVSRTTDKKYNDDMIHIYNSSSLDMLVTKKHKIVLWDRNHKPYILTAEELYNKINNGDSKVSHSYIKNSGEWVGEDSKKINIPNSNYEIDSELWAKFLGIFIADGHCSGTRGGKNKNSVTITQVKKESSEKIIKLLNELPFKYSISNDRQFIIYDKTLYNFLFDLGNSEEKYIPNYAKNWNVNLLNILLDWMLLGDGRNRSDKNGKLMKEYYTISDKLSEDVFEIMLKISNGATFNTRIPEDRYITDTKIINEEVETDGMLELVKRKVKTKRLIKASNSKPLHIISERRSKGISLDTRFTKAEKIPFNDNVYCVTVDNGTWLMRYNGKISWTHNSDHPECHRDTAEILTKTGWKLLKDIDEDEKVLTLNPDTKEIEVHKISKKIEHYYDGKLISIKNNNLDLAVTPNHKFWVEDKNGNGSFITANDIHNGNIKNSEKVYIPRVGNWTVESDEYFTINKVSSEEIWNTAPNNLRDKYTTDLKIPINIWMKFMGIYLADGSVKSNLNEKYNNSYEIRITQKKVESITLIEKMLEEFPLDWTKRIRKDGTVDFCTSDFRLFKLLSKLGGSHDKYIPLEIKNQDSKNLSLLLDWFHIGDGRVRYGSQKSVFSTSKKLINDLQEILIKCGGSGNISKHKQKDRYITDVKLVTEEIDVDGELQLVKKEIKTKRLIEGIKTKTMYTLNISKRNKVSLNKNTIKTELIDYDGYVYCVDVPNHIFYVRDNGKACWNGNSSVISNSRVSHEIKKIWWEGHTLVGEIEILMSPGFVNQGIISCEGDQIANMLRKGIRVGVSSRGVGSLEDIAGKLLVQDDFELICWDIVTSPSTPGSYMFKNEADAQPFMESKQRKNNLIIDKLDRFLL